MAAQKGHIGPVSGADTLESGNQLAEISEVVGRTYRIALLERGATVYGAQCGANDQITRLAGRRGE